MEPNDKVLVIDCEWDGGTVQANVIRHAGGRLLLELEPATWEKPPSHVVSKVVEFKLLAGSTYMYDSSDTYAAIVPELEAAKVDVSAPARVQVHEPSDEDEWDGPTWGGVMAYSGGDLVDFLLSTETFRTREERERRREELDVLTRAQIWAKIRREVPTFADAMPQWRDRYGR